MYCWYICGPSDHHARHLLDIAIPGYQTSALHPRADAPRADRRHGSQPSSHAIRAAANPPTRGGLIYAEVIHISELPAACTQSHPPRRSRRLKSEASRAAIEPRFATPAWANSHWMCMGSSSTCDQPSERVAPSRPGSATPCTPHQSPSSREARDHFVAEGGRRLSQHRTSDHSRQREVAGCPCSPSCRSWRALVGSRAPGRSAAEQSERHPPWSRVGDGLGCVRWGKSQAPYSGQGVRVDL